MKPLSNLRITKFVAAAALAGISFVSAYAAPNYFTPLYGPIDTTSLVSVSTPLNNFNGYLQAIDAQLAGSGTLRTPDLGGGTVPSDADFVAAVASAVAADTAHASEIVSAGVQYKPEKAKDILIAVATGSPTASSAAVAAASIVAPAKAADIALGAIKGLIVNGANNGQMGDAAAAALNADTRELIEGVAKAAVSSTKKSSTQNTSATEVASALMAALLLDANTSNAELYLDDVARGAVAGVGGFASTSASDIATAMAAKFATAPSGVQTAANKALFAMGALKSSIINDAGTSGFVAVRNALTAALASSSADILAGAKVQQYLRQQDLLGHTDAQLITDYQLQLTAGDYENAYAFITGALQVKKGLAAALVTASFTDAQAATGFTTNADAKKQAFVAGATTANIGAVGEVVSNAITAAGGLAPDLAVAAAIPAATDLQSGQAVTAAIKNGGRTALSTPAAQGVLSAAISAANSAGYQRALPDIALAAAKARKDIDDDLVATAIASVPSGWEEAVAAFIVAPNSKEASVKAAAIAAATTKNPALTASVTLALNIAIAGKANSKTLYDDAIASLNGGGSALPRAVIFGAGAVNTELAVPLMAAAMRLKTGGDTDAALYNYALSLNKKGETAMKAAFETAQDAIAHPDNLFDLVDHKALTNPKSSVEIATAAAAARPEYAHYVARAASFRSPADVGKIATAIIQFAHMRTNHADDPAAVAAISAATVLGLKDAHSSKETTLMASAISGLVKGCLLFTNDYNAGKDDKNGLQGDTATFDEATGAGNTIADVVSKRSKGTAGVITGAVAQLQATGATSLDALSKIALTAAAKAIKDHGLAFAQAAGAAAQAAAAAGSAMFTDFAGIAAALVAGGATDTGFANAAQVGAAQYTAHYYGAGAAGIMNYAHHSGLNSPVTSLSDF